jgi:hypothetical protein
MYQTNPIRRPFGQMSRRLGGVVTIDLMVVGADTEVDWVVTEVGGAVTEGVGAVTEGAGAVTEGDGAVVGDIMVELDVACRRKMD